MSREESSLLKEWERLGRDAVNTWFELLDRFTGVLRREACAVCGQSPCRCEGRRTEDLFGDIARLNLHYYRRLLELNRCHYLDAIELFGRGAAPCPPDEKSDEGGAEPAAEPAERAPEEKK